MKDQRTPQQRIEDIDKTLKLFAYRSDWVTQAALIARRNALVKEMEASK